MFNSSLETLTQIQKEMTDYINECLHKRGYIFWSDIEEEFCSRLGINRDGLEPGLEPHIYEECEEL